MSDEEPDDKGTEKASRENELPSAEERKKLFRLSLYLKMLYI